MIAFVSRENIDDAKWDAVVANSWHETVYGYCWYLDCVTPQWGGLVLDDYKAVMPLVIGKKWGFKYIFNVPFMQYTTVYGALPTTLVLNQFLEAIPHKFRFMDFKLLFPHEPQIKDAEVLNCTNYILQIPDNASAIDAKFNTNTKRNIKKAEKLGLTFTFESNPDKLIETYKVFKKEKYNTVSDPKIYERLRKAITKALINGSGQLVYAWNSEGNFLGGTFFQDSLTRSIYLFSGASAACKNTGAMFLIVKNRMLEMLDSNKVIDFEGSDIEGIARFYKGFGAEPLRYYRIKINKLPKPIYWLKR